MKNHYYLHEVKISKIKEYNSSIKLFRLEPNPFVYLPGQFLMVSLAGYGEAPFGFAGVKKENYFEILVRKVGYLTGALSQLKVGDKIGVRGPYGNGFPIDELRKRNILTISGGTGIAPIRSLIEYVEQNSHDFGNLQIFYGARTVQDLVFSEEFSKWQKFAEVLTSLDQCGKEWKGNIGLVTCLIDQNTVSGENTVAILCGPPVMYKAVINKLAKLGFSSRNIWVSLERRMKCGVGKCQHCTCGNKYVCLDGPVFRYDETLKFPEGI